MVLIHLDSKSVYEPFSGYVATLVQKGLANSTISSYTDHTADFLDFLSELQSLPQTLTKNFKPESLFNLYYNFLAYGLDSDDILVFQLARTLNKTTQISNKTISGQIASALDYFLHYLESENSLGFLTLFRLEQRVTQRQKKAINKSSWLSQCIRSTNSIVKRRNHRTKLFPLASRAKKATYKDSSDIYDKAFSTSDALTLLLDQKIEIERKMTLTKSRAYLLDSLQAATGIRVSEALQVTIEDVDAINKTIKIVSIDKRTYKGITEEESFKLKFKGRATAKTLLIEPFATLFWDALKIYLDNYYKPNVSHDFLFQDRNGRPFFACDESTRCKDMKQRLKLHLGHDASNKYSSRSFRHMYGVYLRNYLPIVDADGKRTGKCGLPIGLVQIIMGHASEQSTQIYAKRDSNIAEVLVTLANNIIKHSKMSLNDILFDYKEKKIQKLEDEIAQFGLGQSQ